MKSLIQGAFRNKAAIILLVVMALGLGVISYFKLPMELMPEADNPQVTVSVIGQGYNAATMEEQVTNPLEQALAGIKGKKGIFSTSGENFSLINLDFDSKTDMKEAKAEVERAVANIPLPERASPPYVVQFNTSMIPIAYVALTFDEGTGQADREKIENRIVDSFRSIDGAGTVQLSGKSQPVVHVIPDLAKLEAKGVPLQALYGVLQGRADASSVGQTALDGTIVNLGVASSLSDAQMLKKLPVAGGVALGDVAEVQVVTDTESVSRIDGKDALSIVVSKAANANAVSVGKDIQTTIDDWNKEHAEASLQMLLNTSDEIVHSVNSMMREVLMGALFATLVILLFMRNVRATLVTIVSIPLSMAITLYLLDLSGISLNILTLGGVAVAVGRLVDDSIVVIENIFRRLQKETFSVGLMIDATREVSRAITASTLTTVAVFLPMGLLRGSLQAFLLPFALTVTYSLLSSLAVALTVIPLMSSGVLKGSRIKEHKPSERFTRFLEWNLKHKWLPLLVALALLVGSIGTYFSLPKGAVDNSSAMSIDVSLEYKPDTPVDDVFENGKKLEEFLLQQDGGEWVFMDMGNSADSAQYGSVKSPTLVTYMVKIKNGADADKLIEAVESQRTEYPDAELTVGASSFFGGGSQTQVFVDITGDNEGGLASAASDAMAAIQPIKGILKVESNQDQKTTVYTLEVDPTAAKSADIASQLQAMLNPVPIGAIPSEGQTLSVVLQPALAVASEADLGKLEVMTDEGAKPVSSIAKWVKEEKPTTFYHKDGKPYIRVTASVEPSQLSKVGSEISKAMDKVTVPDGVKLNVGGASADQSEDFASLFLMMIVSIGIVYLIMVFTFKTLRAPLAILASILFVPIGAVLGLIITGVTPDFTAIFGVVMLIGIVVTNAIVLIDRVKQNEERMTIREALLEAAGTRMRPILMTAIATVCAMLPLVFGTSESGSIVSQSLAIVVIGGLLVATLLTLVLVPCLYELLFFRKSRRQRIAAATTQAA
ncbi:efflux RND transporter permease subunit [Cohnella fermenti]|uniref:Efflux RND transporter permease subunit n=1 Tax=Cohnella fermenti TaxID=2565925 RepID=A0A4S4BKB4_9BACL|nr:efflux RND transporter permease subunit [Cohnella fermenti]THF74203.1 efflux RND transporter permease subunit [Cohnella fermenti]